MRVGCLVLQDHRQITRRRTEAVGPPAADPDLAAAWGLQPGDQPQEGTPARSGGADNRQEFPVGDRQTDPGDRLNPPG